MNVTKFLSVVFALLISQCDTKQSQGKSVEDISLQPQEAFMKENAPLPQIEQIQEDFLQFHGKPDTLRYRHPLWEQMSVDSMPIICSNCNQIDSNGLKQGLWVDIRHGWRYEQNYNDGVRSGIYRQFGPRGDLAILGEYINGRTSGIWYIYDGENIRTTCEQFGSNYDTVTQRHSEKRYVPEHKCYSKNYHTNGDIRSEGWILWFEGSDFLMDDAIEYGTWKYYDEDGELINVREHDSY